MSDEIIKVLNYLGEKFGVIIDWSENNILPYIQDLFHRVVMHEVYTSIVYIVVFLIICIGCSISIPLILKYANKVLEERPLSDWDEGRYIVTILLSIIIAIFIVCIILQILDIVTCFTIPEKIFLKFIESTKA